MNPIVSVHTPKCSGISFRSWLEGVFGEEAILFDYADRPIDPQSQMNTDPDQFLARNLANTVLPGGKSVVHGHFWAKKYLNIDGALFVTFLRDPVERLISHYYYWLSVEHSGHSLHRRVVLDEMDIVEFARLPEFSGFYRYFFVRDFDMRRFAFVGDAGRYDAEIGRLETLLGVTGAHLRRNENGHQRYAEEKRRILEDAGLVARLRDCMRDEIAFFEAWSGR